MPEGLAVGVVGGKGVLGAYFGADGPQVEGIGAGVLDYGVADCGGGVCCCVGGEDGVVVGVVVGGVVWVVRIVRVWVVRVWVVRVVVVVHVHRHWLVALVVLVGCILWTHDAVSQVHVGFVHDCVHCWVGGVHAMRHGHGQAEEKKEDKVHFSCIFSLTVEGSDCRCC